MITKIRSDYPSMRIIIRAYSGFSCPSFYKLVDEYTLDFVMGLATNEVLKRKVKRAEKAISHLYVQHGIKHQHFITHSYQAKSWPQPQRCYTKVESTGKGLNKRHRVSNLPQQDAREIYFGLYVQPGKTGSKKSRTCALQIDCLIMGFGPISPVC